MMPKGAVCAEVGVWEGNFSSRILEICEPKELHLIDPWLYQPEFSNTGFGKKKNEDLMEEKYQMVVDKFKGDDRVKIHRGKSDEMLAALPDGSLDWVYLDGNHNAPFIDHDLEMSLTKVKPNGIISGDDYAWMSDALNAPVKTAVETIVLSKLGDKAKLTLLANQYFIQLARG
ncbi:class I SAM-dependent methyltransferase [Rhodobacter lacus]|uniref:Class I SAM-dependent methyltransferase n=1 Tax=Rhodobacter lacus TaxID=1641972 RepID=A0ABW5A5F4_9RHOB